MADVKNFKRNNKEIIIHNNLLTSACLVMKYEYMFDQIERMLNKYFDNPNVVNIKPLANNKAYYISTNKFKYKQIGLLKWCKDLNLLTQRNLTVIYKIDKQRDICVHSMYEKINNSDPAILSEKNFNNTCRSLLKLQEIIELLFSNWDSFVSPLKPNQHFSLDEFFMKEFDKYIEGIVRKIVKTYNE